MKPVSDAVNAQSQSSATLVQQVGAVEHMRAPVATFTAECLTVKPGCQQRLLDVQAQIHHLRTLSLFGRTSRLLRARFESGKAEARRLHDWMCAELMQPKWKEVVENTVVTGGKNDLLDKYFGGSSYTAAWYCGLISSVGWSGLNAADTMASHAGWTEAGPTNAPNYSGSTRPVLTFSAASAGSKATSSASSFTFSNSGTIKGMFGTTNNTKDGTTGILYNDVLFTGGDRAVVASDVVNVSVTYSA